MDLNYIVIVAIKAALLAVSSEANQCVVCDGPKNKKNESPVMSVLQTFLTEDEYLMLGILLRRKNTSGGLAYLPEYGKSTKLDDGCFSIREIANHLETIIHRTEHKFQWVKVR